MKTKICSKCKKEQFINNFRFRKEKNVFCSQCRECERKRQKEYYKQNKENYMKYREQHSEEQKKYNYEHREKIREYNCNYYYKHKKELNDKHSDYNKKNRKKINEYNRLRKKDKLVCFKDRIRINIFKAFKRKGKVKSQKTEEILGITLEEFYKYLLQTYKNNYGVEWDGIEKVHIDHIKPLKYANTEEDVAKLCHYTNLQLLKERDNLSKSSKKDWVIMC